MDLDFYFPTEEEKRMVKMIESNDFSIHDIKNRCKDFAIAFNQVYPAKYKTAKGYVVDKDGVEHEHWWCINRLTNEIFDPTKGQFDFEIHHYKRI